IDLYWKRVNNDNTMYCPLELHNQVINLVELHFSRHILLPKSNGELYVNQQAIWNECQGRYSVPWRKEFKQEWKKLEKKESLSDNLYFTNPNQWTCTCIAYMKNRFFLCKHLVQRNGNYPLISTYDGKLINVFHFYNSEAYKVPNILPIKESIIEYKDEYIVEDNDDNEYKAYEQNINDLNEILIKVKNLIDQLQEKAKGHLWLQNIRSNFKPLEKMIMDIEKLENRRTTPKTSKDFNRNTTYWL
ncbi:25914_t:CDS:2, partial [Gigaspora rosea]